MSAFSLAKGGRVPVHWVKVPGPGGTPEDIAIYKNDPHGHEQYAWHQVDEGGGSFLGLYYSQDRKSAYVFFESVPSTRVDQIVEALEGLEQTDLDTVPEVHKKLGLGPSSPKRAT